MFPPPSLSGRRLLVLGATGFIGRWVARVARSAGATTVLQARSAAALAALRSRWELEGEERIVDLARAGSAATVLAGETFDLVVNLVGYGVDRSERDEGLARRLNEEFPVELAAAMGRAGRLVHVGSALEYGEVGGDLDEEGPHRATTLYGRSKLAATRALSKLREREGHDCLTARLFTVYGPGEHEGRLLPALVAAARAGRSIDLSAGLQRRDFCQVEEVARVLLALGVAERPAGGVINVARGRLESVREFCRTAAGLLGLAAEDLRFGALPQRAEEMEHDPVSTRRLEATLGGRPELPLEEGLRRSLEFNEELT